MTYWFQPLKIETVYKASEGFSFNDDEECLYHDGLPCLGIHHIHPVGKFIRIPDDPDIVICTTKILHQSFGDGFDKSMVGWSHVLGSVGLRELYYMVSTRDLPAVIMPDECRRINRLILEQVGDRPFHGGFDVIDSLKSCFAAAVAVDSPTLQGSGVVYFL